MLRKCLLAVRRSLEVADAAGEEDVLVAEGRILWLHKWSYRRGTHPNPRALWLHVRFLGLPTFLCKEGLG